MVTKDDITMVLYQNIHADEITNAIENGTLLTYFGAIAERIMEMNESSSQIKPINRKEIKKIPIDETEMIRLTTQQPKPIREAIKLESRETVHISADGRDSVRVRGNL